MLMNYFMDLATLKSSWLHWAYTIFCVVLRINSTSLYPLLPQVPKDKEELAALQARLRKRFPVDAYNKARRELDPNKILSNGMLEKLFPVSEAS